MIPPSHEYGPGRRVPTAPQTTVSAEPPMHAQVTDAMIVLAVGRALQQATPEIVNLVEQRIGLRIETSKKAQESAELTMAKRRQTEAEAAKEAVEEVLAKWVRIAKRLGYALGLVATLGVTIVTTAIATYRDAVGEIAAPAAAQVVEAKIPPIEDRMASVEETLGEHDEILKDLKVWLDEQKAEPKPAPLVEPTTVHVPTPKRKSSK